MSKDNTSHPLLLPIGLGLVLDIPEEEMEQQNLNNGSYHDFTPRIVARNFLFCVTPVLLCLLSGIPVLLTRLRRPTKLLLLNLLAGDLVVALPALVIVVYSYSVGKRISSNSDLCVALTNLVTYGIVISFGSLTAISMYNFIAVFYPHR